MRMNGPGRGSGRPFGGPRAPGLGVGLLVLVLPVSSASAQIVLRDVAEAAGISFRHDRGARGEWHPVETMGSGVAVLDYDGDGAPDLFFVQGGEVPGTGRPPGRVGALYRNEGAGRFQDVSGPAGFGAPAPVEGHGMGAVAADVDNDGDADLLITRAGTDLLYENRGDGTFGLRDAGLNAAGWSASAAFSDLDGDGDLDLFITHYLDWSPANNPVCARTIAGAPVRSYCLPDAFSGVPDLLYENLGDGTFADVTEAAGVGLRTGKGLGDPRRRPDRGRASRPLRGERHGAQLPVREPRGAPVPRTGPSGRRRLRRGRERARRHGDRRRGYRVRRGPRPVRHQLPGRGEQPLRVGPARRVPRRLLPLRGGASVARLARLRRRLRRPRQRRRARPLRDQRPRPRQRAGPLSRNGLPPAGRLFPQPGRFVRAGGAGDAPGGGPGPGDARFRPGRPPRSRGLPVRWNAPALLRNGGAPAPRAVLRLVGRATNRDGVGAEVVVERGGRPGRSVVTAGSSYLSSGAREVWIGLLPGVPDSVRVRWPTGAEQRVPVDGPGLFLVVEETPARN